jgi:hypothetical protein
MLLLDLPALLTFRQRGVNSVGPDEDNHFAISAPLSSSDGYVESVASNEKVAGELRR